MQKHEWLSERIIFGVMFITGFLAILASLIWLTYRSATHEDIRLPGELIALVAGGVGALSTAVGMIAQATWKTDKTDKQNASTLQDAVSKITSPGGHADINLPPGKSATIKADDSDDPDLFVPPEK